MSLDNAVIEVAIGMSFAFLVLATIANAATEGISSVLKLRSKGIEGWLRDNLGDATETNAEAETAVAAFYKQPIIASLTRNTRKGTSHLPSYIPSEHAITGLVATGATFSGYAATAAAGTETAAIDVHAAIVALPESSIKHALLTEWDRADGDLTTFRTRAERWFDDAMDRLSGWYKRRVQLILLGLGLVIAAGLNADALHMSSTLYRDPSARQVVAAKAQACQSSSCVPTANDLPLPLGWSGPGSRFPGSWGARLLRILGYVATAGAIALGAPFWFDALSKLVPLRSSGPAPKSTSAAG